MLPIDLPMLFGFVAAAAVLVISPGPDTMLIIRHALTSGPRAGLAALAGIQVGLVGHTLLAVAGLSLLIVSSPILYKGVAVAGAIYLGYLGIQALRAGVMMLGAERAAPRTSAWRAAREACLTNLLNPKVILLFIALMPQFVNPARGQAALQLVVLAAALVIVNVAWQLPVALGAVAMRRWLAAPRTQRAINRLTFIVFSGFAVLMLYEHLWAGEH